jgi:hypothetical protein
MGMTLLIQTLEGRSFLSDSDDHTMMCDFTDELDGICEQLDVQKLSEFYDFTESERNYEEQSDDEESEIDLDPETNLPYGIDDMQWTDAKDGLITLKALHAYASENQIDEIEEDEKDDLLDEIDDCISILEETASRNGQFHLAMVD